MTKEEAKSWLHMNMLIGTKPTRGDYMLVLPFSSNNAKRQIIDHLAEKMSEQFKLRE